MSGFVLNAKVLFRKLEDVLICNAESVSINGAEFVAKIIHRPTIRVLLVILLEVNLTFIDIQSYFLFCFLQRYLFGCLCCLFINQKLLMTFFQKPQNLKDLSFMCTRWCFCYRLLGLLACLWCLLLFQAVCFIDSLKY